MKRFIFVLIFVLLVQIQGYSQTVSAPEPKSFTQSTNGQDASGFVLSGFSATSTLLASISLVNPPSGTTFIRIHYHRINCCKWIYFEW
jgi:hypothetical protein